MTITKISNERKGLQKYHVTYDGKSRCGNLTERSFQNLILPKTVVEILLNGVCVETKYGADGTKIEVFKG